MFYTVGVLRNNKSKDILYPLVLVLKKAYFIYMHVTDNVV